MNKNYESLELVRKLLFACLLDPTTITPNHDDILESMFGAKVLTKKMEALHDIGFDIVISDPLLMILDICADSNPGQIQILFRYLLDDISKRLGSKIPKGYVITPVDFLSAFPDKIPLMSIPEVSKQFEAMWDAQKKPNKGHESDNRVDTVEYWEEVLDR